MQHFYQMTLKHFTSSVVSLTLSQVANARIIVPIICRTVLLSAQESFIQGHTARIQIVSEMQIFLLGCISLSGLQ